MDRDGTKDGYDLALLKAISDVVNIPVVASGGAGKVEDLAPAITDGGANRRPRRLHFSLWRGNPC